MLINPESGAVEQQTPWTRMVTHCLLIDAATFAFLVHLPWIDKHLELIGKLFLIFVGIEMEQQHPSGAQEMIYKKRPRDCFEGGPAFVD